MAIRMEVFEKLVKALKERNIRIAAAESCTAGLFSSFVAEVPGASDVMEYGFVVYSERAKSNILGVPEGKGSCLESRRTGGGGNYWLCGSLRRSRI